MTYQPILIAGPTASGKSALALKLAREFNGTIINADALQVYACYHVLTARPSLDDQKQAPHALYGYVENKLGYSVGTWLTDLKNTLSQIKNTPIIVGGTGLYFKALTEGLVDIPEIDEMTRKSVSDDHQKLGFGAMQEKLQQIDSQICTTIDIQNPRRVLRAIEVFEQTGRPLSDWQKDTPAPLLPSSLCRKIVVMPDTALTDERIKARFEIMIKTGAIEEVEAQLPFMPNLPANKAIGAREIASYLNGEISLEDAKTQGALLTRQYAKRQRSWFRSNMKDWEIYHQSFG